VQHYPDPAQWEHAFRQAALASVRRLDYVVAVLKKRERRQPGLERSETRERSEQATDPRRRKRKNVGRQRSSWTAEELAAAQERGRAVRPLDVGAVLGTNDA